MSRIEQEKRTVAAMVAIYCRYKEGNSNLCDGCRQLLEYANRRLEHCKFGENKSTCRKCPIHCYKPDMREKMRAVMRYAGPRMILFHPIMAIRHLLAERK
ncbi:MAG: nitrous oxide-stimulated promoter family protein [Bacteroidaceae bacterium]|nr:nitrous oxide-stimulated promoter family protein [Bacteroidaceae bacterium]